MLMGVTPLLVIVAGVAVGILAGAMPVFHRQWQSLCSCRFPSE